MDDQEQQSQSGNAVPVPLAQWEEKPAPPVAGRKWSRVSQALLLGAWRGDGVPSANGMRLAGLVWGLLLAGVCLSIYHLQPFDREWGGMLEDSPVGKSLMALVVLVGFLVGNLTLQARQRRVLSPAVSRTVLRALLVGGLLAQWSWRPSTVWVVALIMTPLVAAVAAYVAASLVEQGRGAVWAILGTLLGLVMVVTGVAAVLPAQIAGTVLMAVNPQGPLATIPRLMPGGGLTELPRLMTDLTSRDWKVARVAALAIAKLDDPRTIEPLRQAALDEASGPAPMFAVYALGKLTDPHAKEVLEDLAQDPRLMWLPEVREVRIAAAQRKLSEALDEIGSPDVTKRTAAMAVLELAATKEHLPVILQALKDPAAEVRVAAARTLDRLDDPRALQPLIVAARDSDRSVGNVSVSALADLEDTAAIPALLEAAQNEAEQDRQRAALFGLAKLPDPRSARAMIQWQADQEGTSPQESRKALIRMRNQARIPLIEAATSNEYLIRRNSTALLRELYPGDAQAKAAIARGEKIFDASALEGQFKERGPGPSAKADLILRAARSDDPAVQAVAREKTDDLFGEANEQILMEGRKDPDPRVRAMAIWALGDQSFGGREAERAVQEALKDKSPLVRRAAIQRAEHTFGQGVVDIVVQHMHHDPDVQVRLLAAKRFEEHVPSAQDQPLIYDTLLHDKDPRVRAEVPHIIERRCRDYAKAYDVLKTAKQDPDPNVRQAAQKAIARIDQYRRDYGQPRR
ncbi:MAG: HEAT repeat domain-containing protein [Armatimonadota bacterium]